MQVDWLWKNIIWWGCGPAGGALDLDVEDLGFRFQLCFRVSSVGLWKEFNSLKLYGSYNDSSAYNWNVYVYIKLKEGVYVKTLQNCKVQFYYHCYTYNVQFLLFFLGAKCHAMCIISLILKAAVFSRHC